MNIKLSETAQQQFDELSTAQKEHYAETRMLAESLKRREET